MLDDQNRLLTLCEAAKMFPHHVKVRGHRTSRKRIAPAVLWRWIIHGHLGIRLEGVRTPRGMRTTAGAVCRFLAAVREAELADVTQRNTNTRSA